MKIEVVLRVSVNTYHFHAYSYSHPFQEMLSSIQKDNQHCPHFSLTHAPSAGGVYGGGP
jgi:hypothetical protein